MGKPPVIGELYYDSLAESEKTYYVRCEAPHGHSCPPGTHYILASEEGLARNTRGQEDKLIVEDWEGIDFERITKEKEVVMTYAKKLLLHRFDSFERSLEKYLDKISEDGYPPSGFSIVDYSQVKGDSADEEGLIIYVDQYGYEDYWSGNIYIPINEHKVILITY